jgi:hypothetical protein
MSAIYFLFAILVGTLGFFIVKFVWFFLKSFLWPKIKSIFKK